MKKTLLFLAFVILAALPLKAQVIGQPVTIVNTAPGTCTTNIDLAQEYQGVIYLCVSGNYAAVSTTAAGGSVTGLHAGRVVVGASATTLTDYAGFTHDGTTLTVAGLKDTALTSGRIPFATTGGLLTDDSLFLWDSTNHYLGIGATASRRLTITDGSGNEQIRLAYDGTKYLNISVDSSGNLRISGIGTDAFWGYNRHYLNSGTTGTTQLYGTSNGSGGGSILLYMGSHASLPDSVAIKAGSTVALTAYQNGHVTISASSTDLTSQLGIVPASSTTIGQIIKLAPSQSADALEVQNSSGTPLTWIDASGNFYNVGGGSVNNFRYFANGNSPIDIKGTPVTFTVWNGAAYVTGATLTGTSLLGVGVSPSAVVHAYTTGSTNQFTAERNTGTAATTGKATILHSQVGYTGGTGADSIFRADWGWSFQVNNQSSPANLLILTNSGKVGISNTNPTAIFQMDNIIGTTTVMMALKAYASQTADFVQYQNSSGTVLYRVTSAGSPQLGAWIQGSNADNLVYGDASHAYLQAPTSGDVLIRNGAGTAGITVGNDLSTTLGGNLIVGPSTIESFTTNASALGTLNYYTDSQTIYYDTAAATGNVTVAVKAAAGTNLDTRLATGQAVTLVLKITNTGTAYNIAALTIDGGAQTIKWLNGSAPAGNINAVDTYTFYIYKTGSATFYVEGTQQSYK